MKKGNQFSIIKNCHLTLKGNFLCKELETTLKECTFTKLGGRREQITLTGGGWVETFLKILFNKMFTEYILCTMIGTSD